MPLFFLENDPVASAPKPEKVLVRRKPFNVVLQGFRIFGEDQEFLPDDSLVSPVDPFKVVQSFPEKGEFVHVYKPSDFQAFSASTTLSLPLARSFSRFLANFKSRRSK